MSFPRVLPEGITKSSSSQTLTTLLNSQSNEEKQRPRSGSDSQTDYEDVKVYQINSTTTPNNLVAARRRFYNAIYKIAPLPEKHATNYSDLLMYLFDVACAGSGLPLYMIGSAAHEEMIDVLGVKINIYVAGAAYANFLQNILYAHCFAKATRNFKNENKQLLAWSVLWGIITAYVPTAAMFRLGFRRNYSVPTTVTLTVMTFTSTFPLSFFGMYEAFKRIINTYYDNPKVREFLLHQLRVQVKDNPRDTHILKSFDSKFVSDLGFRLGIFLAISQVLSIEPWVCDSEKALAENLAFPIPLSWILSVGLFNLPNLLIAASFSGFDQGAILVNAAYKSCLYLSGEEEYHATFRESAVNSGLFLMGAVSLYFCFYSSMTSVDLMIEECPSAGLLNPLLVGNVNWGTIWGNYVMTMFAVVMMFSVRDQLSNMHDWINSAPAEEIEEVAATYFPNTQAQWQRPEPQARRSWGSRLHFLSSASSQGAPEEVPLLTVGVEQKADKDGTQTYQSVNGGPRR